MSATGASQHRKHRTAAIIAGTASLITLGVWLWQTLTIVKMVSDAGKWWMAVYAGVFVLNLIPNVVFLLMAWPLVRGHYAAWLASVLSCGYLLGRTASLSVVIPWMASRVRNFSMGDYWLWTTPMLLLYGLVMAALIAARNGLRGTFRHAARRLPVAQLLAAAAILSAVATLAQSVISSNGYPWLELGPNTPRVAAGLVGAVDVVLAIMLGLSATRRLTDAPVRDGIRLAAVALILTTLQFGLSSIAGIYFGAANTAASVLTGWALLEAILAQHGDGEPTRGFVPILAASSRSTGYQPVSNGVPTQDG